MNPYLKTGLILLGIVYLISPVDLIPNMLLPFVGWLDDGVVMWLLYYLIRYGKLPGFLFNKKKPATGFGDHKDDGTKGQTQGKNYFKSSQTPYEILGIDPSASKEEIQQAYREGIKKYHPDKVSHLGEEFSRLANKKFIEIQAAYEALIQK